MRRVFISFLFLCAAVMQAQKINPSTQINWPGNCNSGAPFYNIYTGLCVAPYTLPSTLVYNNQANTYSTGLQDFSAASMKQPATYTVGSNTITNPTSAGTLALTSQLSSYLPLAGGTLTGSLTQTKHSAFGANAVVNTLPTDLGDGSDIPSSTVFICNELSTAVSGVNCGLFESDWNPSGAAAGKVPIAFSSDLNMNLDNSSSSYPPILGAQIVLTNGSNTVVAPETEGLLISMNNVGAANINGAHVVESSYTNYGTSTSGADSFKASVQIPSGGGQMASWTGYRVLAPVLGGSNGVTTVIGFSVPVCQIAGVTTCHPWESLETTGAGYNAGPWIANGYYVGSEASPTQIISPTGAISAPTINGIPMTGSLVPPNLWTIGIGYGAAPVATTVGGNYAFGFDSQNATTASLHDNTSMGEETLMSNSKAIGESAFGSQAEKYMNSTSGYNSAGGSEALRGSATPANNTGSYNSTWGAVSFGNVTTASYDSGLGYYACFNITTGSYDICLGANSGEYITGGSTPNQTSSHSIYLGYNTEASADGNTNEIVIGDAAVGNGSNTATIGNSSTTSIHINGSLINANGTLLSSLLTGAHGAPASDVKVQLSDGTGTSGYAAVYDANGGLTNGAGAPLTSASTLDATKLSGSVPAASLVAANQPAPTTTVSSGSIGTVTTKNTYVVCTSTCNLTPMQAAAGVQLCVRNAPGSATVITLNALASGNYYELTTHAGWGTAAHNLVSGGLATDSICLVGYDATHYLVMSFTGTWTD